MEPLFIEADYHEFIVHFEPKTPDYKMSWSGSLYEIQKYTDGSWRYQSNSSSDSTDKKEDARCWFEWSFCWRGVWEGRVYFKDDEYWSEEMKTIAEVWQKLEAIVKERIKKDNTDYGYFDE
jgi:hypothetical protein